MQLSFGLYIGLNESGLIEQKTPGVLAPGVLRIVKYELAEGGNVGGLQALGPLFDFELDLLAFFQAAEAIGLNSGEVYEDIVAAFMSNKAVALATIEPFDCAGDTF